jgi:hypothetical protein
MAGRNYIALLKRRFLYLFFPGIFLVGGIELPGCGLGSNADNRSPGEEYLADSFSPSLEEKKASMERIHKMVVQIFTNQPGFGEGRVVLFRIDRDIVQSPSSLKNVPAESRSVANDPRYFDKFVKYRHGKKPEAHVPFQQQTDELNLSHWFESDTEESWEVRKVQLVGLIKHKEPVAYESDKVSMAKGVRDLPTRTLDEFEMRGLEKLRSDEDFYFEKLDNGQVRALGPIYAGARCVACHEKPGELLGGFTYTFEIVKGKAK